MVKRLLALISIIGFSLTIWVTIQNLIMKGNIVALCILAGVLTISITTVAIYSLKKDSINFINYLRYLFTATSSYSLNIREATYEFIDRTHMVHTKHVVLKSAVNNFYQFTDRYNWSKKSACNLKPIYDGQQITYSWQEQGWNFYTILLNKALKKRDTIETGIIIEDLVDESKESMLFLSSGIYEKTKLLRLCVKFGPELMPKRIKFKIYKNPFDPLPYFEKELAYDHVKNQILLDVKYPIFSYKYFIVWEFDE